MKSKEEIALENLRTAMADLFTVEIEKAKPEPGEGFTEGFNKVLERTWNAMFSSYDEEARKAMHEAWDGKPVKRTLSFMDPKRYPSIASFAGCELLLRPGCKEIPYVAAHGFDPESREWSQGGYHADLIDAILDADPDTAALVPISTAQVEKALRLVPEDYQGLISTESVASYLKGSESFPKELIERAICDLELVGSVVCPTEAE